MAIFFLLYLCRFSGNAAQQESNGKSGNSLGKIVYSVLGENFDNGSIYIMNEDGSGQTRLHNLAGVEDSPCISPDGTKIAYGYMPDFNDKKRDIYQMNIDGSEVKRLTFFNDQTVYSPCYSPDGKKLIFSHFVSENWDLYTLDLQDGTIARLTMTGPELEERQAVPSPDGKKLLCVIYSKQYGKSLYLMNSDGSSPKKLGDYFDGPSFSPDGTKIAYYQDGYYIPDDDKDYGIMIMDLKTGSTSEVIHLHGLTTTSFSRDGSRLLFNAEDEWHPIMQFQDEIFSINLDGTDKKRLTTATDSSWKLWPMAH